MRHRYLTWMRDLKDRELPKCLRETPPAFLPWGLLVLTLLLAVGSGALMGPAHRWCLDFLIALIMAPAVLTGFLLAWIARS